LGAIAAVMSAAADTKTFNGESSNDWHTAENWSEEGVPTNTDDVIIPAGLTCIISNGNAVAKSIDVASTAVLRIVSRDLTVGNSNTTFAVVDIDGDLQFSDTGTDPRLLFYGWLDLQGSGTIDASDGNGYGPCEITNASGETGGVQTGSDLTVKGSVYLWAQGWFYCDCLFLVDDADDTMRLGEMTTGAQRRMGGTGTLKSTAGLLQLGRWRLSIYQNYPVEIIWSGSIVVDGSNATVQLTEYTGRQDGRGSVEVKNGGTLDIDTDWGSEAAFSFTNGTIEVARGMLVTFEP
jgi:hypothetical protein